MAAAEFMGNTGLSTLCGEMPSTLVTLTVVHTVYLPLNVHSVPCREGPEVE
jgi:hypothetical protein